MSFVVTWKTTIRGEKTEHCKFGTVLENSVYAPGLKANLNPQISTIHAESTGVRGRLVNRLLTAHAPEQ